MPEAVNHYQDRYWNDLSEVLAYLCRRATGNPDVWWMDYIKQHYAQVPRKRALVIGCGNGWVERDLYDRGIAEHFDAFDIAEHYLETAKSLRGERSIRYFASDFASFVPTERYDLIVNVAALHHACRLYGFLKRLAPSLTDEGIFVNWDYVGPSRNQYSCPQVRQMREINRRLPPRFRTPHPLRPALNDMLAGDPTEAVHAADIVHAVGCYFDFIERRDLGGGIAYQLLWNNLSEFEKHDQDARDTLSTLLREDAERTARGDVPTLFSFFICKRRQSPDRAAAWHTALREPLRESFAAATAGLYPRELPAYLLQRVASKARRLLG